MNRWSLRNNRSKLETSGALPIILEESLQYTSLNEWKQNRKMSTCNRLGSESLGSWPTLYAQKLTSRPLFLNILRISTSLCSINVVIFHCVQKFLTISTYPSAQFTCLTKFLQVFSLLTHKNLHKKKCTSIDTRILEVLWLVKEKNTHVNWHTRNWNDTFY